MGTQLISFRLKDEEVALLMQYASSEENASLTAQRVIRQLLGTQDIPSDKLTSLLTQVNELREQVKSVKIFIDETINERLEAVDRLVDEAVHQQMQAELLQARGRFDKFEQRLDKYFQILRASGRLPAPEKEVIRTAD
jgi:pyridoxal/pyridoxine/pyridoxamine kinase